MPYADPSDKLRRDRDQKRSLRKELLLRIDSDPDKFRDWLSYMSRERDLTALLQGKAWSSALAMEMERDQGYASHLRAMTKGEVKRPHPKTAYQIGEALRSLGLKWCNGLLGLLHRDRLAAYSVIDIAYANAKIQDDLARWFLSAHGVTSTTHFRRLHRSNIIELNDRLDGAFKEAWSKYKPGGKLRRAHGMLGLVVRILEDPRSGPEATRAADFLVGRWHESLAVGVGGPYVLRRNR